MDIEGRLHFAYRRSQMTLMRFSQTAEPAHAFPRARAIPLTLSGRPLTPLSRIGNSFAARVSAANVVDQTARFGGIATSNPGNASAPVNLTSISLTGVVPSNLRYAGAGTYQYQVTASSTTGGVPINQSVTLNLTVR